jgi:signal transduction histidine kinase
LLLPTQIPTTGRFLIIRNLPADTDAVCTLLRARKHEVMEAGMGAPALAVARATPPDLVLLDLPLADSVAQLQALHNLPGLAQVPAIFLVDAPLHEQRLAAFDAGALGYLVKPVHPEELLARMQVQLRLKLTRDRLEHVARERQQLVNLVAHDLKNPLSSVLFACEMLAMPDCKPERAPRYLQIIDDSAREALGYIRHYLHDQATPGCPLPEHTQRCAHLGDVVQWLATRYELQLEANAMQLRITLPDAPACVSINEHLLRQVGENLISNALKYARAGGELELHIQPGSTGHWQLCAQDRGPGIAAAHHAQLFQPFQRAGNPATVTEHSSGLGLALSRQLIQQAGGRLWYEDRATGGARFVVELPATDCAHCWG